MTSIKGLSNEIKFKFSTRFIKAGQIIRLTFYLGSGHVEVDVN